MSLIHVAVGSVLALSASAILAEQEGVSLLDEAWSADLLINEVKLEPVVKSADAKVVKTGDGAAKLTNVADPAGWPNVRFVAGEHLLGALKSGESQLTFDYRTDAWNGRLEVQIWAFLGEGEPVIIATSETSAPLTADDNWHEVKLKLTVDETNFAKIQKGARVPTYVWFIPKEGWGKAHTTYLDDVRIVYE